MKDKDIPFSKTIPGVYERYLGPYLYESHAVYVTNRIKGRPQRVLEIGAGSGRLTRNLAAKIGPNAKLIAIDINTGMIEVAK